MDRTYENGKQSEAIRFFVGKELERTPMYGELTLFVVGNEFDEEILNRIESTNRNPKFNGLIKHIYFAANHSYDVFNDYNQLQRFLNKGYNVTYECTVDMYEQVRSRLPLDRKNAGSHFVVMLSAVIPNIDKDTHPEKLNHIILKIDDTDKNRTNAGVWCHDVGYMLDNDRFTDFVEYGNDTLLD